MQILEVTDPKFRKYGRVVTNVDFSGLVEAMQATPLPDGVDYVPSLPELEALPIYEELKTKTYGELAEICEHNKMFCIKCLEDESNGIKITSESNEIKNKQDYNIARVLKQELQKRNNPTDLKSIHIGTVINLEPLTDIRNMKI